MCPSQTSQSTEWHLKCQPSFHWGEENTRFVCSDEIRTFLSPETPKDIQPTVKYHGEKQQIVTFKSLKHVSVSVFNLFFFPSTWSIKSLLSCSRRKKPWKKKIHDAAVTEPDETSCSWAQMSSELPLKRRKHQICDERRGNCNLRPKCQKKAQKCGEVVLKRLVLSTCRKYSSYSS